MATEIRLPQWGMGMQEGTVAHWLKQEGDPVAAGDELVEIEAAKVNETMSAPVSGVLLRILVPEGETIPVRTVLALVGAPDEALASQAAPQPTQAPTDDTPPAASTGAPAAPRVQITPVARKLAKELGVDLAQVTGSGPHGRIDEDDVRAYVESLLAVNVEQPQQPTPERTAPFTAMRHAIARNMLISLQTMAQLTLFTEADVTELVRLRERLKHSFDLTYTDLIIQATARALERHPALNASLDGDIIRFHNAIHIGLAVALDDGLIVPVIRDANRKPLREIAATTKDLIERAQIRQLTVEEVIGATFTITNLGRYGIDGFTPVINPPEAAILGIGRIIEKPAVYHGAVVPRHMLTLSLTHDHRLVDGVPAAAFLRAMTEMLETPYLLGPG